MLTVKAVPAVGVAVDGDNVKLFNAAGPTVRLVEPVLDVGTSVATRLTVSVLNKVTLAALPPVATPEANVTAEFPTPHPPAAGYDGAVALGEAPGPEKVTHCEPV